MSWFLKQHHHLKASIEYCKFNTHVYHHHCCYLSLALRFLSPHSMATGNMKSKGPQLKPQMVVSHSLLMTFHFDHHQTYISVHVILGICWQPWFQWINKEWKHWNFHGQLCLLRFRREGFKQANRHPPTDLGQWLHCCQEKINSLNWNYPSVSQLQLNASPLVWLANNDIVESRLSIFPIIHLHVVLWWQVKHTSWLQRARSLFAHLTTQVCLHMLSSPVSGIMQQPFRKWQSNAFDWSLGSLMAQSMAMHTKSKYSTLTPPSFAMKSLKMFNGIVAH